MKAYTEYLQAHPAVREALQEHELECWDFFMWEGDVYVVTAVGCDGVYANKHDSSRDWFNTEEDLAGRSMWLPTLGQLVRMLEAVGYYHGWGLVIIEGRGHKEKGYAFNVRDGDQGSFALGSNESEPEIACTALWAKVKGVESD